MIRPIIQAPNPLLNMVAHPVPRPTDVLHRQSIKNLLDTFDNTENCVGLAATQLGFPWRVIVVDITPRRSETYVMVNPVITKMSEELQLVNDGCMSVEGGKKRAYTKRPKRLQIEWTDPIDWSVKRQKFSGLLAACIHHEVDHLDGVLFVDRIIAAGSAR